MRTMVLDRLLGPQPPADLDRFVGSSTTSVEIEFGRRPLTTEPTGADTEKGAPVSDCVKGGYRAGSDEGMP